MKNLVGPALVVLACIFLVIVVVGIKTKAFEDKPVVYSPEGVPHCPYCSTIVKPFTDYCFDCKKNFAWSDGLTECWDCRGTGDRKEIEWDYAPSKKADGDAKIVLEMLARWERGHERLFKEMHNKAFEQYAEMPWGG